MAPKDDSVVKSFRTTEAEFNAANEIFHKEGFTLSEVIRLLLEATIKEGRIPRGLSTKSSEVISDMAERREDYIDSLLDMALPDSNYRSTGEKLLYRIIFDEAQTSKFMSNAQLRDWGASWGLPEELSVSTLADLHDNFLSKDPWQGDYDFDYPKDEEPADYITTLKFMENIKHNLERMKHNMEVDAIRYFWTMISGGEMK